MILQQKAMEKNLENSLGDLALPFSYSTLLFEEPIFFIPMKKRIPNKPIQGHSAAVFLHDSIIHRMYMYV